MLRCNVPTVSASSVAARDVRRVGQAPSVGHDRVSPGREPRSHGALGWATHSLHRFTDTERCRLARKAHTLGRKALNGLHTLITPDTLLRWYREMVACKWNYSHRRGPGRPRAMQRIANLVLRMALENRSWGYTRIQGAMANLGHEVGRSTIASILREYGVDPAPERDKHMPGSTFLRAHRECLVATDFLTVEVCTIRGLVTHYVLLFIDIVNRAVKIAGITPHPDSRWMTQIAWNLTDPNDSCLRGKCYLILDRDTKYLDTFCRVLVREGVQVVRLPARSPNLNAFTERFVRSIKGVFKPDDLLRTGIASARGPAVHGALSYRAQSSGSGKPNTAANVRRCPTPSPCSTPTAHRRNAQLLPSGRSLTNVEPIFLDNAW